MPKVYVEVTILYRDEKVEVIQCCDTPGIGGDWITVYPVAMPLSRRLIAKEKVEEISWNFKV